MSIAITEDHRSLASVARSFAADNKLRAQTRELMEGGPTTALVYWAGAIGLGLTGLHLPDSLGGQDGGLPELAVVLDEFGAAVAPGPFLPSVIGSAVLARCASDGAYEALIRACCNGSNAVIYAQAPGVTLDGRLASGTADVVGAAWATHFILAVGADLLVVQNDDSRSVSVAAFDGAADPALGLGVVTLSGADCTVLLGQAAIALATARTLAAAEASGGARATLDMALAYAKIRTQFGRAIGSFQAVKHHLANMRMRSERVTAAAWDAARAWERTDGQAELAAAVAATIAFADYQANAEMNIQIHGGIGFTWEHDAHLYLRRAITLNAAYGSTDDAALEVFHCTRDGSRRTFSVDLPPEAEPFRIQAHEFVERFERTDDADRRRLLVESGYLVPHWPEPFGRAAGSVEQLVIEQELAHVDVPTLGIGGWVMLTLFQHGTPEQVERWIRPGLLGEHIWCQLFSEPNAGSDAAAVQTRAERVDGGWRITGQKVWTSGAHLCHRGLATVRTNPSARKHKGITAVVVDLHAPGVEVRPLREITGEALFNEVFFDDVFVPDEDVVGEVDEGWTVARTTLGNERVTIGGGGHLRTRAADLVPMIAAPGSTTVPLEREVGTLIADEQAMQLINLRSIARNLAGAEPGAEGSITKLLTAEHMQHVSGLALRICGTAGIAGSERGPLNEYLLNRAMTIAGGTSEISRNVIAEQLLGLPREARGN